MFLVVVITLGPHQKFNLAATFGGLLIIRECYCGAKFFVKLLEFLAEKMFGHGAFRR